MLLLCLGLTSYFSYHALYGRHGLETRSKLVERSRVLEQEIDRLETVRARLEVDTRALGSLPAFGDLAEEMARARLGLARPGDIVILLPTNE